MCIRSRGTRIAGASAARTVPCVEPGVSRDAAAINTELEDGIVWTDVWNAVVSNVYICDYAFPCVVHGVGRDRPRRVVSRLMHPRVLFVYDLATGTTIIQ